MMLGLANFVGYTVVYSTIGGDAKNGGIDRPGEGSPVKYMLQGDFLHGAKGGDKCEVSKGVWIYSYIHSITIWPTIAAVLLSILTLARPHIIATMREESFVSGQTLIAVFSTVMVFIVGVMTIWFIVEFVRKLTAS
jgi:hypothetical protein